MSSMNVMRMQRGDLLKALRDNRDKHEKEYAEAKQGYYEAVEDELTALMAAVKSGGKFCRTIKAPEPHCYLDEYDAAIAMLEMCMDDFIEVSAQDFQCYVLDRWSWKERFNEITSNYLGAKR